MGECQQPALHWQVHLARRAPFKAVACLAAAVAVGGAAFLLWRDPWVGVGASLILLATLSDFLLPLRYCLDSRGVSCRQFFSVRRMGWEQVRRCYDDGVGIKLSPLARPSRLEAYRGIYLWLDGNREEVLATLHRYRGRP